MNEESDSRPRRPWLIATMLVAMGLLAVWLGIPRFVAGIEAGPQDDTLRELAGDAPVSAHLIERTMQGREEALRWLPSGSYYSDLATLQMASAAALPPLDAERRRLIADAIRLQGEALTLAPADAYGWGRLLQALAVAARPVNEVEGVLDMALRRAPNEPGLVLPRLRVALLYWGALGPDMRERLAGQIRLAALWMPSALLDLARARFAEDLVASALAPDPRLLARFNYVRASR